MVIRARVSAWLSHTRFVPTPLYRLVLVAATVSAVLQLVYGAPTTVSQTSDSLVFDWAFVGVQLVGAVLALTGLYLVEGETPPPWVSARDPRARAIDPEKLHRSLTIELLGLIFLQTCMAVQIVSTIAYYGRPPAALSTWVVIVFWAWSFFRDRDILRALRKLTR
ncbi:membrane protein [Mycobacterium phage Zenteno07]|nr:membrane protein [Mycobacterium phage Zenteno07]